VTRIAPAGEPEHESERKVTADGKREIVFKRGRLVTELGHAPRARAEYPQMELQGAVTVIGDIVEPVVPEDHWESLDQRLRTRE